MKQTIRAAIAAALLIAALPALVGPSCIRERGEADEPLRSLAAGDPVPDFTVELADGGSFSTADMRRSPCLLFFFDIACSDCRRALPALQQAAGTHGAAGDGRIVCISRGGDPAAIAAFWADNGLTLAYSAQPDRSIYELFANRIVPRYYFTRPAAPGPVIAECSDEPMAAEDILAELAKLR